MVAQAPVTLYDHKCHTRYTVNRLRNASGGGGVDLSPSEGQKTGIRCDNTIKRPIIMLILLFRTESGMLGNRFCRQP